MNKRMLAAAALCLFSLSTVLFAQDGGVSKKQDVAVFALGYSGFSIPSDTLANVDAEIQGVFVNLGRFNVLGQTERFSSKDVQDFTNLIRTAKSNNTPLPEEVKFGEVQLTESLMNKLFGAFVVVIPTIVEYKVEYANNQHQANIKTSVVFLNVAEGTTIGLANIQTSGSSKETESKAIRMAIDSIPFLLTYEVRKIPAFIINTKVLRVSLTEVKMQLGADMGVKVGDEYVVIERSELAGLVDEREDGLILIKNVGPQISTGAILYSGSTLVEGAILREVPRMGVDIAPYLMYLKYFSPVKGWVFGDRTRTSVSEGTLAVGAKATFTRGYFNFKPLIGAQINLDDKLWLPIIAYGGLEYNLYLRRLAVYGQVALAGGTNVVVKIIEDNVSKSDEPWFTHGGIKANAGASYLISRDMKVFVDVGMEYLFGFASPLGGPFQSFGGYGIAAGVAFKL